MNIEDLTKAVLAGTVRFQPSVSEYPSQTDVGSRLVAGCGPSSDAPLVRFAHGVSALVTKTAVTDAGFEFDLLAGTAVVGIGEYHAPSIALLMGIDRRVP